MVCGETKVQFVFVPYDIDPISSFAFSLNQFYRRLKTDRVNISKQMTYKYLLLKSTYDVYIVWCPSNSVIPTIIAPITFII